MKYSEVVCRINCEPGWFGNPFCHLSNIPDGNMLDVMKEFVTHITSRYNYEIRLAEAESYLFASLMEYLYWEAPDNEQNFFMIYELLKAALINETGKEFQLPSDLDRLYLLLQDKNSDHMAIQHYTKYKDLAGNMHQKVITNAMKHISQFGIDINGSFFEFLSKQSAVSDEKALQKIAKAFVSMMHDIDDYCYLEADEYLLLALIYVIFYDLQTASFRNNSKIQTGNDFLEYCLGRGVKELDRLIMVEERRSKSVFAAKQKHPAVRYYTNYMVSKSKSKYSDKPPFYMLELLIKFFNEFK